MSSKIRRTADAWRAAAFAPLALLVLLSMPRAGAAVDTVTPATLTGPVTVATADGKVVKGTVQTVTPELLTVLPAPKPPAKVRPGATPVDPPAAAAEPLALEWKDVKRASGGLSARSALDMWKAQHAGTLCDTCRGERTVWCPTCKGTAHDPAAAANCKTCKGELLLPCKSRGETDGVVPCPNGCLRLGVGAWSKHPDGQMWCKFAVGNGGAESFSEHNVGDVIVVDFKAHSATDAGKCPICGGTTKVDDPVCHGTGKVPCPECVRRASAGPCPARCLAGRVTCPDCGGTGLKKT